MARLSKSEFERYDPNVLAGCADRLRSIVDGLGQGADDSGSAQKSTANNFQGKAADAIGEQAAKDIGALRQAHGAVDGLRAAYANGPQTLTPSVNALREAQHEAARQGFNLLEDWQLKDTQSSGMNRTVLQHRLQEQIDSAVTALDQADEQASGDIAKARQVLVDTPFPQTTVDHTPAPAQPDEPKPDEPKPDEPKPQDQGQPGDVPPPKEEVTKAGSPGDNPPMKVAPGSSDKVQLQDHPPGYDPHSPKSNDEQWQDYLNQRKPPNGTPLNADGTPKNGGPPMVLPNPNAVKDPGLRAVGAAAQRQGTSYAWGGGHGPQPGASRGTLGGPPDDGSRVFHDDKRIGLDCSGLVRDGWSRGAGIDINRGNEGNTIGQYRHLTTAEGSGVPVTNDADLRPGDLIYYGPPGASHHVAMYVGNGMVVQAHQSGEPVEVSPMDTGEQRQMVRPKS